MSNEVVSVDIVIAGAGIVGSALACTISASLPGVNVVVLDPLEGVPEYSGASFDPRVVALSPSSSGLLQSIGVWEKIVAQRVSPYTGMYVWDGEGTANISFDCADVHAPYLGHIVENSVLVKAMRDELIASGGVRYQPGHAVADVLWPEAACGRAEVVTTRGDRYSAPLVVAADGANSPLRQARGLPVREWSYDHTAIVTTVGIEKPHQATAWQRFSAHGPLAFLPLPSIEEAGARQHFCSIVWSLDKDVAEGKMCLSDDEFCEDLARTMEGRFGAITSIDKRFAIPLYQRHAQTYIAPHLALLGDAAHTIHPLAGQGVNLGLHDVKALLHEIERAVDRRIPLSDPSVLSRYQRARKAHNLGVMSVMEMFKRLFGSEDLAVNLIRNRGMDFVDVQRGLKKRIMTAAMF